MVPNTFYSVFISKDSGTFLENAELRCILILTYCRITMLGCIRMQAVCMNAVHLLIIYKSIVFTWFLIEPINKTRVWLYIQDVPYLYILRVVNKLLVIYIDKDGMWEKENPRTGGFMPTLLFGSLKLSISCKGSTYP